LSIALDRASRAAVPPTLLARAQGCWDDVVGPTIAAQAAPTSGRGSTIEIICASGVWAHEIELLSEDLRASLNEALSGCADGPIRRLRVRSG